MSGKVINVATGTRISLNDLFTTLKAITGATVEPVYGPTRAGDVRDSLADITLARDLLGYAPPRRARRRPARDGGLVRIDAAARVRRRLSS